jgi:hypothetical protein
VARQRDLDAAALMSVGPVSSGGTGPAHGCGHGGPRSSWWRNTRGLEAVRAGAARSAQRRTRAHAPRRGHMTDGKRGQGRAVHASMAAGCSSLQSWLWARARHASSADSYV